MTAMRLRPAGVAGLATLAFLSVVPCCVGGNCAPRAKAQEGKPAAVSYHFGTHPARTTVTFESETSLETIHGTTRTMSGAADLDFDKGEGGVELTVPVKSLDTGIEKRNEHLQTKDWLDAAAFPDIVFKSKSLKRTKTDDATKRETWSYEGELTIHGVTKALKGEATVLRIPEEPAKKLGEGDWVKVKTRFDVALADFGVKVPDFAAAKVSPAWTVAIDIFGTTVLPKPDGK
jgi:polyisoprenoid-binding protein YceI